MAETDLQRKLRRRAARAALYFETLEFPPPDKWRSTRGLDRREYLLLMSLVAFALDRAEQEGVR